MEEKEQNKNNQQPIGKVIHYFDRVKVAVVSVLDSFAVGDSIKIVGPNTEFSQVVSSIEKNHQKITRAEKGEMVGLEVIEKVKKGYLIYKG
ncbi:MAG: U32 family peptidase C-terminal domain-containing protein [Minisyncoccales bacterium]